MIFKKILPYSFLLVILALFFYSFTQVDLGLTLTRASIFQIVQRSFQQIGYFNRETSTVIFLTIVSVMYLFYISFLDQIIKKRLKTNVIRNIVILTGIILSFSYIAFSYDLFNYIFDAKIITFYHQNPYFHKALDYPGDPMLAFMHWTHRLYPYGPVWLGLSVPLSLAGFQIFLVTYFLFKFMATAFYFGSVYLIYKINKKINPGWEVLNTVLFALNPLVIVESLVSSHNDITMVFFALLGFYLFFTEKRILGIILVLISSQVKIPTLALLLPMFLALLPVKAFKFSPRRLILFSIGVMFISLFYALTKLEIQPWYFLWIAPFVALLKPNKYIVCLTIGLSIGLLLRYSVFLYSGNWDGILVPARNIITLIPIIFSLIIGFVWSSKKGYNLI